MFGAGLKHHVAFQATGKGVRHRIKFANANYLPKLLPTAIVFDQEKIRRLFLFDAPVTSENQPVLPPRRANQSITGQMGTVDHVLSHDPEPFGEFAEHAVGGEIQISVTLIHTSKREFGRRRDSTSREKF